MSTNQRKASYRGIWIVTIVVCAGHCLPHASAVTLQPGDILVSDLNSPTAGAVIHVNPATGAQMKIASGTVSEGLFPEAVALGLDGSVFIVAKQYATVPPLPARVVKIDPANGNKTVVSEGGNLVGPADLAIDDNGDIWVVDQDAPKIVKVNPNNGAQTIIAQGQSLSDPVGIVIEADGNLLVADNGTDRVIRIDPAQPSASNQTVLTDFASSRELVGIALGANGEIYVIDLVNQLSQIDPDDGSETIVCPADLSFFVPGALAVNADGNYVVAGISAFGPTAVARVNEATCVRSSISSGGNLSLPTGVTVAKGTTPPPDEPDVPDLIAVWSNVKSKCKEKDGVLQCSLKGNLSVQNKGDVIAEASVTSFYLSDDALLDASDTQVGLDVVVKPVAVGKPGKAKLKATLPVGVNPSGKFLLAVVDAVNTVSESDESNNLIAFGPVVLP